MHHLRLIPVLIVILVLAVGCSEKERITKQAEHTQVKQAQKAVSKKPKQSAEFESIWLSLGHEVMPFMAYSGYLYAGMSLDMGGVDPDDYTYIGDYAGWHFYARRDDTQTPPLELLSGPSPGKKLDGLKPLGRCGKVTDLKGRVAPARYTRSNSELELSVEFPDVPYTAGTLYPAILSLKNISDKDVVLWADRLFDFRIVDARGHAVWTAGESTADTYKHIIPKGKTYSLWQLHGFYVRKPGTYRMLLRTNDGTAKVDGKTTTITPYDLPRLRLDPITITVKPVARD